MVTLDKVNRNDGASSMKVDYDLAGKGLAGVELAIIPDNWSERQGIELWLKPIGQKNGLTVQIFEEDGEAWKYSMESAAGAEGQIIKIPFSRLTVTGTKKDGMLDLGAIVKIGLYAGTGAGKQGKGTMYIDTIQLY